MKIAVTYQEGNVFPHFGHTASFKVYDVQNGVINRSNVIDTKGQGHGALVSLLQAQQVDTLICGGIGLRAKEALQKAGITLISGASGQVDQVVEDYLSGRLNINENSQCRAHSCHH